MYCIVNEQKSSLMIPNAGELDLELCQVQQFRATSPASNQI